MVLTCEASGCRNRFHQVGTMKALILAGGYGTRLQRDIRADTSGQFEHLSGVPKPLLPIGGVPLSTYLMRMLKEVNNRIEQIYLISNKLYLDQFHQWAAEWPSIKVICDGSTANENRPGAVGCISIAVRSESVEDDMLILGGDTLFYEDFDLGEFIDGFNRVKDKAAGFITTVTCSDEDTWKRGIVEVDQDGHVTAFLEKVGPEKTHSRLSVPCFYIFSKRSLHLVDKFLDEKKDLPIADRDAPGNFVRYLSERQPVFTFPISGRFDVGSLASYKLCDKHFMERETKRKNEEDATT